MTRVHASVWAKCSIWFPAFFHKLSHQVFFCGFTASARTNSAAQVLPPLLERNIFRIFRTEKYKYFLSCRGSHKTVVQALKHVMLLENYGVKLRLWHAYVNFACACFRSLKKDVEQVLLKMFKCLRIISGKSLRKACGHPVTVPFKRFFC